MFNSSNLWIRHLVSKRPCRVEGSVMHADDNSQMFLRFSLGPNESTGWRARHWHFWAFFSLWTLFLISDPYSYLNISHSTYPQSNTYIIWKELISYTENHPFEMVAVDTRGGRYLLSRSVALRWSFPQLISSPPTIVFSPAPGVLSNCWLRGFADFTMRCYLFFLWIISSEKKTIIS